MSDQGKPCMPCYNIKKFTSPDYDPSILVHQTTFKNDNLFFAQLWPLESSGENNKSYDDDSEFNTNDEQFFDIGSTVYIQVPNCQAVACKIDSILVKLSFEGEHLIERGAGFFARDDMAIVILRPAALDNCQRIESRNNALSIVREFHLETTDSSLESSVNPPQMRMIGSAIRDKDLLDFLGLSYLL